MTGKVFISYRRSEDIHVADRLADALKSVYPMATVFLDTREMPAGGTISATLEANLRASDAVLVLIGRRWATVEGSDGRKRLDNPADYVRQEVEIALHRPQAIVPVLIDDAVMPAAHDLPDNMHGVIHAPGFALRGGADFTGDLVRLVARLDPLVKRGSIAVDCGGPGQAQRRWIVPGGGEAFRDFEAGPEMVVVPAGHFTMGSPANEPGREPEYKGSEAQVKIDIVSPFAVGRFTVTRDQFERFVDETDYKVADGANYWNEVKGEGDWTFDEKRTWLNPNFPQTSKHPVVAITWNDANQYVQWLSRITGRRYRLPTSAEWEYAARAGTVTPFWWGASIDRSRANYDARETYGGGAKGLRSEGTCPVNSFELPNPWGLHQVHGNVWEMVADKWPGDSKRATCRGGSFEDAAECLRSATCDRVETDARYVAIGFRVARDID